MCAFKVVGMMTPQVACTALKSDAGAMHQGSSDGIKMLMRAASLAGVSILCLRLQEEVLLSLTIAMAISWLLYSLRPSSANDYAFACFFLICTTSLLKIR